MQKFFDAFIKVFGSYKFYVPLISIIVAIILIDISNRTIEHLIIKDSKTLEAKRRNTLVSLAQNILKYIFLILALLVILHTWGINISAFLTGLGIVGVVGGLALQDALKDIIMGCNIILDNYYVVGDTVEFDGFTGTVIEFGLKNTKIQNVSGVVLVVSNREISRIYNLSQHGACVQLKVPIAYEESEEKVKDSLLKVCDQIDELSISTKPTVYLGIEELDSSSVNYLIRAYSKAGDQYELKRLSLGLIKKQLDKDKIKIPYNQIEVHNGK